MGGMMGWGARYRLSWPDIRSIWAGRLCGGCAERGSCQQGLGADEDRTAILGTSDCIIEEASLMIGGSGDTRSPKDHDVANLSVLGAADGRNWNASLVMVAVCAMKRSFPSEEIAKAV